MVEALVRPTGRDPTQVAIVVGGRVSGENRDYLQAVAGQDEAAHVLGEPEQDPSEDGARDGADPAEEHGDEAGQDRLDSHERRRGVAQRDQRAADADQGGADREDEQEDPALVHAHALRQLRVGGHGPDRAAVTGEAQPGDERSEEDDGRPHPQRLDGGEGDRPQDDPREREAGDHLGLGAEHDEQHALAGDEEAERREEDVELGGLDAAQGPVDADLGRDAEQTADDGRRHERRGEPQPPGAGGQHGRVGGHGQRDHAARHRVLHRFAHPARAMKSRQRSLVARQASGSSK